MNSKIYFICLILLFNLIKDGTAQKQIEESPIMLKNYPDKIDFISNQGQWEEAILYQAEIAKTQVRFLKDKISFGALTECNIPERPNLDSIEKASKTKEEALLKIKEVEEAYAQEKGSIKGFVWNMHFDGANSKSQILGKEEKEAQYNYYLGSLKAERIGAMGEVWYKDIYPNTDVRFYSASEGLEYDIILYPKAKSENVRIELEGIEEIRLDEEGNLVYNTPWGEMVKKAPYAYQMIEGQEVAISTKYRLDGNYIGFEILEDYNQNKPLIIDPLILKWSTYLGGAGNDNLRSSGVHNEELYLHGTTLSIAYPTTAGSFQQIYGGGSTDVFFSKLDKDGNLLVSTFIGGNDEDYTGWSMFQNGTWYVEGSVKSTDFPVTAGAYQTTYGGGSSDAFFLEVNSNLQLEYSTYLGGGNYDGLAQGIYHTGNNMLYVEGSTGDNTTFPSTKNALNNLSGSSNFILAYNTAGHQVEEVAMVSPEFNIDDLVFDGTNVFALGRIDASAVGYTTQGAFQRTYGGGSQDVYILKLDNVLDPIFATYIGGSGYEEIKSFEIKNNSLYLLGVSTSNDFPTTAGVFQTTYGGGYRDLFAVKMDLLGNVLYSTYIGGGDVEDLSVFVGYRGIVEGDDFYVLGRTESADFPTTAGAFQPNYRASEDNFIVKLNSSGQADWATYFAGYGIDGLLDYTILNNELVILGYSTSFTFPTTAGAYQTSRGGSFDWTFSRLNLSTGYPNYSTYIGGSRSEFSGDDHLYIDGTDIYIVGETRSSDFPVTPGVAQSNSGGRDDWAIVKINQNNTFEYATYLGGNASDVLGDNVRLENGKIHLLGGTNFFSTLSSFNTYPTTVTAFQNTHRQTTEGDFYYSQLDASTGTLLYSTLIGGSGDDSYLDGLEMVVSGEDIYIVGGTKSVDFPVTQGAIQTTYGGGKDIFALKLSPCVDSIQPDTILPLSQTVCREATVEPLIGGNTMAAFPTVLRNNVLDNHTPGSPSFPYQWQDSIAGGNWTIITGATGKDYLPPELTITTYYRRVVLNTCGDVIGYSNESVINVTSDQAPVVDGGDNLLVCTGGSIQIGAPTTGGTPGYTYAWTPTLGLDDPTIEQPTATVTSSTVYTVQVTDANGCIHKDQALVNVMTASAGPDVFACQGSGVRIGSPAPAGATTLTYAWSPTTGLSDPSIAQPIANPVSTTTYTVTVTGPNGCPLVDDVEVTPVSLPTAGSNETTCLGTSVTLGQPSLAGYSYEWTPNLYLSNSSIAQPTFTATSIPNPNPLTYSLTAIHDASGCVATSSIEVTASGANAGIDGCGPRTIGTPDESGGTATYSWSVVSGDAASLTTPTVPEPIVNPTVNTIYELSVARNGVVCTDQVLVTANCGCPAFSLTADSDVNCAIGDSLANTTLSATFTDTANYLFSWSPATDLSSTNMPNTSIVGTFTNNRTYTLTITNKLDPAITCSQSIQVFGSNTSLPEVQINDTIACIGVGVQIGTSPVAGRSYQWFPSTDLNDPSIADPIATLDHSRLYVLEVTDNATGCSGRDTMIVVVRAVGANAGEDAEFCDGAVITLGTSALPNRTYAWEPANALGAPNEAQPTDTIFITTDYYLTVTDTLSGCIERDTITFTERTAPVADAGVDSVSICRGGGVRIGTPAVAGVTYTWLPTTGLSNPNIAQPIASPTNTTTYQLIASIEGIGCYSVDEIKVKISSNNAPPIGAGNDQNICLGGSATLGIVGSPNLVYAWSPATGLNDSTLAQPTATPTDTTVYSLMVTDTITGCTNEDDVVLFVGDLPTVDAGSNKTICANSSFAGIGPYSSKPGYTYSWSPTTGLDDPNTNRAYIEGLSPNSNILYTLLVTDAAGCMASDTVRVIVRSNPIADAGPDVTACSSAQIGTAAISGYSYSWIPSTGLSSSSVAQPTATIQSEMTYIVRVYDSNFCSVDDTVVVRPTTVANAGNDVVICNGERSLIGTPAETGTTYTWYPSAGLDNPNIAQPMASPTTTTTYVVMASNNGCVKMDTMEVTVLNPTIDLGGDVLVCNGSCATIGIPAKANKSYQWSPNTGVSLPNNATTNVCPTATTTYTLVETDLILGCVATDDIIVEVGTAIPPVANAGRDTSICPGNATSIGSVAMPNYTYTWSPVAGLDNPYIARPIATPSATTTYVVTVVDNATGCSDTDTIRVEIGTTPTVPTWNDITICSGSSSLIGTAMSDNNIRYNWSPTSGLSNPAISNPIASPNATTTYQLTVTDTLSGCTNSTSLVVNVVNGTPVIADAGTDINACVGDVVTLGSTNTTSGATYTWSPSTLLSSGSVAQPNKTIPNYWTSGIYRLTVTLGGCTSIDEVVVNAKPEVIIEAGDDKVICNTATVLEAEPTSVTNQWSVVSGPNTPIFGDINSASSTLSGLIPGVYVLRWNVSGSNICNAGYDQVQITVGAVPQLNITNPATACPTVDITAPLVTSGSTLHGATLSYWTDSVATIPVNNPTDIGFSGTYFIQARTNLGCKAVEAVQVDIDCSNIFLPIELLEFTAQLQNKNTALLNWKAIEELGVVGFEIEQAMPSSGTPTFEKIAWVESQAMKNTLQHYYYEVPNLTEGTHYFRLKQLEANGLYSYSEIRALTVDKSTATIVMYPNPAKDQVIIELSEMPKGKVHIQVMNALGQMLWEQYHEPTQFLNLNLTDLVPASYMVKVQFENEVKVFKLIKE